MPGRPPASSPLSRPALWGWLPWSFCTHCGRSVTTKVISDSMTGTWCSSERHKIPTLARPAVLAALCVAGPCFPETLVRPLLPACCAACCSSNASCGCGTSRFQALSNMLRIPTKPRSVAQPAVPAASCASRQRLCFPGPPVSRMQKKFWTINSLRPTFCAGRCPSSEPSGCGSRPACRSARPAAGSGEPRQTAPLAWTCPCTAACCCTAGP